MTSRWQNRARFTSNLGSSPGVGASSLRKRSTRWHPDDMVALPDMAEPPDAATFEEEWPAPHEVYHPELGGLRFEWMSRTELWVKALGSTPQLFAIVRCKRGEPGCDLLKIRVDVTKAPTKLDQHAEWLKLVIFTAVKRSAVFEHDPIVDFGLM